MLLNSDFVECKKWWNSILLGLAE